MSRQPWPSPVTTAAVLMSYAGLAAGVPVHLGMTHLLRVGLRWLLPVVAACAGPLLQGTELVAVRAGGVGSSSSPRPSAPSPPQPSPVQPLAVGLNVVPLLAILLVWQAIWLTLLRRLDAPAWLGAAVGAVEVASPTATALPLV